MSVIVAMPRKRLIPARISNPVGSIRLETRIAAPQHVCFDLARSVDAHLGSTARSGERVVAGRLHGLLGLGESVTWEARHLGLKLRQGSRISRLDAPHVFVDESVSGPLRAMRHVHQFVPEKGGTRMVDTFDYELPAGVFGRVVDRLFVESYLRRFLRERADFLKAEAERSSRGG